MTTNNLRTDCEPNNPRKVEMLREKLNSRTNIDSVVDFLKIISDPTRMKMLLILEHDEVSVNDIAVTMDMTKSAISHQLKLLKDMGYVKGRKEGRQKYYTLYDDHIVSIIHAAYDHVQHC